MNENEKKLWKEGAKALSAGWFNLADIESDDDKKRKIVSRFFRSFELIVATHNDPKQYEFLETFFSICKDFAETADYTRLHDLKWDEIKDHAGDDIEGGCE